MKKEEIKELMELFSKTENVSKFKLKQGETHIELEKETLPAQAAPTFVHTQPTQSLPTAGLSVPTEAVLPANEPKPTHQHHITSPMVGTFYRSPAPGASAFVNVGDVVSKGQTVAIVEAMKIMNDIEAEYDCKIVKLLIEDGQPVEYDMPLYEVEKL